MRRLLRIPVCFLLTVVLLLNLLPSTFADGSDIIFLALNDTMPYALSAGTMPFWSGGTLYVHSTTFNITSLNLSASYNAANMTLLLYSGATQRSLTFYLSDGYVQTQSGATESVTASMRGDQVFLPLNYCAGFFGIGVSYLTSLNGWPLVRLTTGAQVWEDVLFVEKADKLITERADKYLSASTAPVQSDPPPAAPPEEVPPEIVTEPEEPETPPEEPPGEPPEEPEDLPAADPITVYPAVVGIRALRSALPVLNGQGLLAAIYLDADTILENSDLVRQLYAAGHSIGVYGDADAANDALDLVLCRRSLMTLDQAADGCLSHYAEYRNALPEESGSDPILLRLDRGDAGEILTELLSQNDELLQLRETTALFTEPPIADEPSEEVPDKIPDETDE